MRTHLLYPIRLALIGLATVAVGACAQSAPAPNGADEVAAKELSAMKATETQEQANLANFDDLDFRVYSGQKWDEFSKSHAQDIVVHWPDGRTTTGLETHLADLKGQFVFAPDTSIKEHPIKIAQGAFTAVKGTMTGTFTKPMPVAGGQPIAPTNKSFKLDMMTIGRWENGVMKEEWLMWDNQAFMKQIGLAK